MGFLAMPHQPHHRAHGHGGGSGLSVPMLAFAAALVTGAIMWLSDASAHTAGKVHCSPFSSFLDRRHHHAHVTQMLAGGSSAALAATSGAGLDPAAASALGGVAADAMRRVGWRAAVSFARFEPGASLDAVLSSPASHAGAFVLILAGNGSLARRGAGTPFLAIHPAAADLSRVLAPAAAALNAAAAALEAALGRRLFPFRLESAPLPPCASGTGPCAVWEATSGRLVLDSWLAARMAAAGTPAAAAAAADGGLLPQPAGAQAAASSVASARRSAAAAAGGDAAAAAGAAEAAQAAEESLGTGADAGGGLAALLAAFVEELARQAEEAGVLLRQGAARLPALAAVFARAGASSVAVLMASQVPLWWCIACPLVLGMLAPFAFNFGLTAAADALCAQLQLPDDTCSDLWWGAFALALVLSLASAVPIVYLCRLPQCGRRGGVAAAAAVAQAARMVAT